MLSLTKQGDIQQNVNFKAVHLLKIALLVTGQWVTDCVSIKLFMLYSQGQRWKMGLWGCKY